MQMPDFYGDDQLQRLYESYVRLQRHFEHCRREDAEVCENRANKAFAEYVKRKRQLKKQGRIPRLPHEKLGYELDAVYPNATSRNPVSYNGRRYVVKYHVVIRDLFESNVLLWEQEWRDVGPSEDRASS